MSLKNVSGRIEKLQVTSTKREILFGSQMGKAAHLSAVLFASAGMAGAAAQTSMNSDASADDVDLYVFEIANVQFTGMTRQATFKNGDHVDVVFDAKSQGNEALGVRRPATRSIWLCPYSSRGSRAAKLSGALTLFWSIAAFLVFFFLFTSVISLLSGNSLMPLQDFAIAALIFTAATLAIGALLSPNYLRFSRAADEVFAAFGYEHPRTVDLQKTSKAHRKANKIPWTWDNKADLWY